MSQSQKEFEAELAYLIGQLIETIGLLLIRDDYKDYINRDKPLSPEDEAKRLIPNYPHHHWQYGELLVKIGQEVQKESEYKPHV